MKFKFLAIVGLAASFSAVGCKSAANTNTAVLNTNTNTATSTTTATAMPTAAAPATDTTAKAAVEAALKAKGITGVTVDATTSEVTLRGTVAKGKLTEAIMVATETGKRKVNNQLTEAK